MKNIFRIILALFVCDTAIAQSLVVSTGFDNYNGTIATVPTGWVIGWNTSNSYYTSTGNFGASAPSYKFGNDSDYVVAPKGLPGMDSVSFFVKGNGTPFSSLNDLRLFQSADSITWTQVAVFGNLPTTGTTLSAALNGDPFLKFIYHKEPAGGNIAFDDVMIYSNQPTGISGTEDPKNISVFPVPSAGMVFIAAPGIRAIGQIDVYDMIGNRSRQVLARNEGKDKWSVDLSGLKKGVYLIRFQAGQNAITRRVTITY